MKRRRAFTATSLRLALSLSLFVIIVAAIGGVYVSGSWLRSFAVEVSHASADAQASHATITTLQQIQEDLTANREVIERANNIVADSQSYQYQDEIIEDLNGYAAAAGVTVTNFNFNIEDEASPDSTSTSAPTGLKSTIVSVSLQNPVNYDNLLRFLYSIEQNLTKMQIANISLTKDIGNDVNSEDLTIEVYIR